MRREAVTGTRAVASASNEFAQAVCEGLSASRKWLPCRFLYDAEGSHLFEEITTLEEYYPTRAETAILREYASAVAAYVGSGVIVVDFGPGAGHKSEILLASLFHPRAYVPIDLSPTALAEASSHVRARFPVLRILPLMADFTGVLTLPAPVLPYRKLGFFPGSTIGNFDPPDAVRLLRGFASLLGPGAKLIVGVDLEKATERLLAAYNDSRGVTARFNLNILARINRELGGDFDPARFRHLAIYDETRKRVEMHLVCREPHLVSVLGRRFRFEAGETIHTESCYKYSLESFRALVLESGWRPAQTWFDRDQLFSVHLAELPLVQPAEGMWAHKRRGSWRAPFGFDTGAAHQYGRTL
jgi:dimethylhistidine N-methyltransferase